MAIAYGQKAYSSLSIRVSWGTRFVAPKRPPIHHWIVPLPLKTLKTDIDCAEKTRKDLTIFRTAMA